MKVSLNAIKYKNRLHNSAPDPAADGVEKLTEKIGAQLGAIEEIIDIGTKYKGIVVVKVVLCADHPNADKLHVCIVDDGGKVQGVERDSDGHVQIVCGAPNVREGMFAAWLPPGSTVPSTIDKDPFVLEVREIRGVKSNGMMASPKELGFGDSHEGIQEITEVVKPGDDFAELADLTGETVIDIENKMFTHRPDCFGFIGVARELAGIQHQAYKSAGWYTLNPEIPAVDADPLPIEVVNEIPELVPRFTVITMRDVELKQSPVWLQALLSSVGLRPINIIVDYSNYFMINTGQPIHIYDYDKVMALSDGPDARLIVRHPKQGEKITLLNGKTIEPSPDTMMVATDKALACVGGAIGGSNTEVDENTKNIIIEAATWDMYQMRRTSMEYGIFTDAVTRFTKGQSPLQNKAVVAKIVNEIHNNAGGKVASELIDDSHVPEEVLHRGSVYPPVDVSVDFINVRLGLKLSAEEIANILTNVEFEVEVDGGKLKVKAPFWRTDIEIPEDIVEEVGRLYGYDKLPLDLPQRDLTPANRDKLFDLKAEIRDVLSDAGANEVLTYSFVHGNLLDKVGQDKSQAFQLANALSPDLQYYRMSLTPSLLEKIHPNIKLGFGEFALYEIGKAHVKGQSDEDGLPKEFDRVAFVFAADSKSAKNYSGAPFYQAKKYLMQLLDAFGLDEKVIFEQTGGSDEDQAVNYYEPGRSATINVNGDVLGRIGEYKASVRRALKLPGYCAGFELGLAVLQKQGLSDPEYIPISRFPKVFQDLTLKINAEVPYSEVFGTIVAASDANVPDDTFTVIEPLNIYQNPDDLSRKHVTFRFTLANYQRTLTDTEVAKILDKIAVASNEKFGAERV